MSVVTFMAAFSTPATPDEPPTLYLAQCIPGQPEKVERIVLHGFDWANDSIDVTIMREIEKRFDVTACHGWTEEYNSPQQGFTVYHYDYEGPHEVTHPDHQLENVHHFEMADYWRWYCSCGIVGGKKRTEAAARADHKEHIAFHTTDKEN